ncbi:NAD(P)-dependent oxidoreductase [Bradyrhizobium lablabi]|uniref:NAD-dependent epimerase/dehydratase family protein n=1 Tax=Bradyrhizobium lablabi TaxID=722472 RepID=UPI001BABADB1|nr:NAD(P)-dependent oxidoreductase [Bradyrhizobium lablabi]MBR0695044.1 NAD(P)-dependent oxidoreductase [Bradyrhizobium lablabi]
MANDNRKVLLVGGAGYVGSVMTAHLLKKGWSVRCLDQLIYKNESSAWPHLSHPQYEFMRGDIRNPNIFPQALKDVDDVVILAGLVGDPITKTYPEESDAINRVGVGSFIDAVQDHSVERLIFVSTCSNYGLVERDEAVDENYPLAPLSLYAKHKVAMEQKILALKGRVGFCPTVLRFATAFGLSSRMRFDLTVNEFVRELHMGKELLVFDPKTWRPYCHVKDFSRAVEQVLTASADKVAFEVFNVGCEANNFTKLMIVEEIVKHLPRSKVAYQERGTDPRNYRVNFEKIRRRLNFTPEVSVQQGISEILASLRQGLFDHVEEQKHFFGNYEIFLPETRVSALRRAV